MNEITITVNNKSHKLSVSGSLRLLDMLRDELHLTGTKEGCAVGECGACTVIVDGEAVCSCLLMAAQCDGSIIETVEGLATDGILNDIQQAFIDFGGSQCGYCTPGMLMSIKAMLDKNPDPSDEEIKTALEGNICRCTGYIPIMNSIKAVTKADKHENKPVNSL